MVGPQQTQGRRFLSDSSSLSPCVLILIDLRGALLCLFEMKTDGSRSLYSCAVKPEGRPRGNNDRSRPRRWHRRPPLEKKLHNN